VPELYVEKLLDWPTLAKVENTEEVMPAITAHIAPGHTPGHLIFRAARPRARRDLCRRRRPRIAPSSSPEGRRQLRRRRERATIETIMGHSGAAGRANIMVRADMPMVQKDGRRNEYLPKRERASTLVGILGSAVLLLHRHICPRHHDSCPAGCAQNVHIVSIVAALTAAS